MKKKFLFTHRLLALISSCIIVVSSCKKDEDDPGDPHNQNEEEVITTLMLIFTDSATSSVDTFMYRDPDGDGGDDPTDFDTIHLMTNSTYYAQIILLDESDSNEIDTISNEVLDEANDHMFFFHFTTVDVNVEYDDEDTHPDGPFPIGLSTIWRTVASADGSAQIILKHQPDEKDGTEDPGETDVNVSFVCEIE
jgi:hypothetical protein